MRYPQYPKTLAVTVALVAPTVAQAGIAEVTSLTSVTSVTQAQPSGTVQDIQVTGTSELLANFLKATLSVQPGTPLTSVNLRQVEQEVVASGYFKSAVAELRTVGGQDTLVIAVVPNPTIGTVDVSGLTFLPAEGFKNSVAEQLNIAPGATLNTQRLDQAKEALANNYLSEGFPFTPSISTTLKNNTDGTVNVTFVVDESAPIKQVRVEGVSLLPAAQVKEIFSPIYNAKKFNPAAYYQAVQQLQQAYDQAGVLQAGVDTRNSTLKDGVLTIKVVEGKVATIDLSDLGNPTLTTALQTQVGQTISLERLRADVRMLANLTGKPVGFAIQADPTDPSQATVLFGAADVASGPVKSLEIKGNTLVPSNTLLAAIKTKVGDTYSPQLAQDDFMQLRDVYRKAGYEISTRDAITFENGALTYNIHEVQLAGYELQWQGTHRTKDRVITRELPPTGKAFNLNTLRDALGRISRLGFVTITNTDVRSDPQNPENITYIIGLSEAKTGIPLTLGLGYDSLTGWSGDVSFSNPNLFGLGHSFNIGGGAQQNDAKQNFYGSASYTIPWLDLKFLDFDKVPTSLSFSVGSTVAGNNALLDPAKKTASVCSTASGAAAATNVQDTCRDYTVRTSGFSVSAGRRLSTYLTGNVGVGLNYKTYYLEPTVTGEQSSYDDPTAAALLPQDTLTTRLSTGLNYDSTTSADFPDRGVRANLGAGYSFGVQGTTPLNWTDVDGGASTYLGFGKDLPTTLGGTSKQQVLAVRVNGGTLFGTAPAGAGYYVGGGSNPDPSKQLRGIDNGALFGTNYFTSSVEYRYNFGLKTGIAQGLYGVLFADAGSAWGGSSNPNFNLNYGIGAGVQLNLGFGGAALPSLRFDYGFNPATGKGQFYFRLGGFW